MIKNGKPYTVENGYVDAELLSDLPLEQQDIALNWIRNNIYPRKNAMNYYSSYGLKHILEQSTGLYLTNNQFKDAMMICGYNPVDPNELNWTYRISKKSPAFQLS